MLYCLKYLSIYHSTICIVIVIIMYHTIPITSYPKNRTSKAKSSEIKESNSVSGLLIRCLKWHFVVDGQKFTPNWWRLTLSVGERRPWNPYCTFNITFEYNTWQKEHNEWPHILCSPIPLPITSLQDCAYCMILVTEYDKVIYYGQHRNYWWPAKSKMSAYTSSPTYNTGAS